MRIQDILLIVITFGVMFFGFFLVWRLERFFGESDAPSPQRKEKKEPTRDCVMLDAALSDEEIITEIRAYEKQFGSAHICISREQAPKNPTSSGENLH